MTGLPQGTVGSKAGTHTWDFFFEGGHKPV